MTQQKKLNKVKKLVRGFFKNSSGEPFEMTDGQAQAFLEIINPKIKWQWISAPTRYGKSDILAIALIYLAVIKKLKIPIVAGSEDKAKKIMEYIIQHISDHPQLYKGLINIDLLRVEQLKISVAKDVLRWHDGGWIYITSIDSRSISKEGEGVVGEGGDVIVLEEAGLIRHREQFSKVVRMPEENRGWGKLIMSGNCIENSVFEDAFKNPIYHKTRISLEQAIAEGRYTAEKLEEQKSQTTSKDWKRYYMVEFPLANEFTYFKPKKMEFLPKTLKYYGALDPALGESKKGSMIGISVIGVEPKTGQAYEVEALGLHIGPDEAINVVFNMPYKFERFGIERVQFQRYFLNEMTKKSKELGLYIPFVGIDQRTKKEERIESLEPAINTGQILFRGNNMIWEHMQDYPESEYLDVLDSFEMAWRLANANKIDFAFV